MGWSGRAPALPASESAKRGATDKEHAMSQTPNTAMAVIGIDIGKNSFHVVGHDARGAIVLRQKWSRGQVEARLANMPPCLIGMEGLCRRASPQSQTQGVWSRRAADAGQIRAAVLEGTEE